MVHERFRIAAIAATFVLSIVGFFLLPAGLPPRLVVGSELTFLAGRFVIAFALPAAALCICLLFRLLANIDPLRANHALFRGTYDLILNAAILYMLGLHLALLWSALGGPAWLRNVPHIMLAAVLLVVGNVLPRVRPNFVVGIRTPWSLRSSQVWARTHHIGGYVLAGFGVAILVFEVFSPIWLGRVIAMGVVVTAAAFTALSYFLWRAQQKSESAPDHREQFRAE